ncbi:hypothetical protein HK096_004882 [Nowakowskiella sp. JEL0078]|nr:hypothetical protein HK096_004882 [Nowakowskiella sp. JEL0078]
MAESTTKFLQTEIEQLVSLCFSEYTTQDLNPLKLATDSHLKYLKNKKKSFVSLDASRPWLCFWTLNSANLLDLLSDAEALNYNLPDYTIQLLKYQHHSGGFAGGFGQLAHLAATYAAVHSLALLQDESAWLKIDRQKMHSFLLQMKQPDGSFIMHKDGESDVRGSYCAISVAKLLNILTPELKQGCAEYIRSCQTYEGGIGGLPGLEAHGGYTYCGVAALALLKELEILDLRSLTYWATSRQMSFEGGFQGRTNKLVDGCYSFWMGGVLAILETYWDSTLYDHQAMHKYTLTCSQLETGGFRDRPEILKWDEDNITLTESQKSATMKITEPKTPYIHYNSDTDQVLGTTALIPPMELETALNFAKSTMPSSSSSSIEQHHVILDPQTSGSEWDDSDEEEQDEEEVEQRKKFTAIRAQHYNMKNVLRQAKLNEEEHLRLHRLKHPDDPEVECNDSEESDDGHCESIGVLNKNADVIDYRRDMESENSNIKQ